MNISINNIAYLDENLNTLSIYVEQIRESLTINSFQLSSGQSISWTANERDIIHFENTSNNTDLYIAIDQTGYNLMSFTIQRNGDNTNPAYPLVVGAQRNDDFTIKYLFIDQITNPYQSGTVNNPLLLSQMPLETKVTEEFINPYHSISIPLILIVLLFSILIELRLYK